MASTQDLFGDSSDEEEDEQQEDQQQQAVVQKKANKDAADNDDDDVEDEPEFQGTGVVGLKSTTLAGAKLADDEEEQPEDMEIDSSPVAKPAPPKKVQQATLKIPAPVALSDAVSVHVTKLPNLMGIQTQPFDAETYLPSAEDEDFGPSAASLVRWRYQNPQEKGDDAPIESNTRLVEWEDGSFTLHIGKEAFEMDFKDSSKDGFAGFNGYLFQSLHAHLEDTTEPKIVLECVAPVASRVTVHPTSLTSEAHKSLTVAVRQKTLKQARVATLATQEDPEQLKAARIRASADVHKQQRKSGGAGARAGSFGTARRRRPGMSRGYLEDEDDDDHYDTTNIRGMKRRVREGEDLDDFIDDDDDEDEESSFEGGIRAKRSRREKEAAEESSAEEELVVNEQEEDEDDEEEAAPVVKHKDKKPAHRNIFEEEDDDDDDSDNKEEE